MYKAVRMEKIDKLIYSVGLRKFVGIYFNSLEETQTNRDRSREDSRLIDPDLLI